MKPFSLLSRLRPGGLQNALLSTDTISLLLAGAGMLSLLMALAGEVGWLSTPPGHFHTLMATMAIQFASVLAVRLWPRLTLTIFAANLILYIGTLALVVYFNPAQPQLLFAAIYPVMAAYLIVATWLGVAVTVMAMLIPRVVSGLDHDFLVSYEAFILIGSLISYWLSRLFQQLLGNMEGMVARLDHQASHDALTGALNRRGIYEQGETLVALHRRTGQPLTLALLDLDYFKQVNDLYGHEAGDAAICEIVARLRETFRRRCDLVGRLGGDELVVILPDTPPEQACQRLLAFAEALQQARPTYYDVALPVALSIGVATLQRHHHNLEALLGEADERAYQAKSAGRSHICCPDGRCYPVELGFTPPAPR